ncbi:MAG: phenylalanine--tRNA ligase subunit beta [Bacteroidales bacterium]
MYISYNWLKQYVDFSEDPEELAELLTDSGLEVEGLEKYEAVKGGLEGVVTGKVLSCEPHPNADKLTLTKVDVGQGDPLPIVCGAPNVDEGQNVLVARVGTTLYPENGTLEIKKAKIRGEVSEGMICAEDELGLGDSHEGIMVLPEDAPVGMPASQYFELPEDWVFEIGLTPNRIDAASHIGVARDIVAVLNYHKPEKKRQIHWPDVSSFSPDNLEQPVPVYIEDPDACPRYSSLTISDVSVKESPEWLKTKLKTLGLKPQNNVVDVTNFVLHEMGQPLHAFDLKAIDGKRVTVKKSPKNTGFKTLEEEELELTGNDLMICSDAGPMCMAGIMGGADSGVKETTTHIFLESACFDPVTIRKSGKHHGIKSEASFRFERGTDPEITIYALKRAAMLIREVAGGTISSDVQDTYPNKQTPVTLQLDLDYVHKIIGKELGMETIRTILLDLDFNITREGDNMLALEVPLYRVDVTRQADVVEEILRVYGYNNIEVPSKMSSSIVIQSGPDKEQMQNVISDMLSARGFNEIMNNSLTKAAYFQDQGFDPGASVPIVNPLSQDLNAMRQSLVFGGLESVAYNKNRQIHDMKLYEVGNVYVKTAPEDTSGTLPGYLEKTLISLLLTGNRQPENWKAPDTKVDFFDVKSAVYAIIYRMGIPQRSLTVREVEDDPLFVYGLDLLVNGEFLARMGLLSPQTRKKCQVKEDVWYACLEWEKLVKLSERQSITYVEVPRYPEVRRDLALLLDNSVRFADIERLAFNTEKHLLKQVNLFDVYRDEKLGDNNKSYAVSFLFQHEDKTLTDKEVDKVMDKLTKVYEQKLGASLR